MEYDSNNYEINGTYDAMEYARVENGEYEYDIGETDGNYVRDWVNDILSEYVLIQKTFFLFINNTYVESTVSQLCLLSSTAEKFHKISNHIHFLFLEQQILLRNAD